MATTYIETGKIPAADLPDGGSAYAEILNQTLCGAKSVTGALRWLKDGRSVDMAAAENEHELVYLMEGRGVITLDSKDYPVDKGAGVYLGPSERASIRQTGAEALKLFQITVLRLPR